MDESLMESDRVIWVGAEVVRGGATLRRGVEGTVVNVPGSFSGAYLSRETPLERLLVRFDKAVVQVQLDEVDRLPPPAHPLTAVTDPTPADWWINQMTTWDGEVLRVDGFVPSSLTSATRILHPFTRATGDGEELVRWTTAAAELGLFSLQEVDDLITRPAGDSDPDRTLHEPLTGDLDRRTAAALLAELTRATTTPDHIYVAIWIGYGDQPQRRFPGAVVLPTTWRGHFLVEGPPKGIFQPAVGQFPHHVSSGIWWPADRAWFVHTEIDLNWTFVAGSRELIDRLAQADGLEAVSTTFDAPANHLLG